MDKEPAILINGNLLENSHAITIRVPLDSFATNLRHEGLGDDEHGKSMTANYLQSIDEIWKMILQADLNERKIG
jgi:hypothetical protein